MPVVRMRIIPVVVLSNNDGCAVARSDEAKSLGVRMGQPFFQFRHLQEDASLVALSANFGLYGDMSDRFMSLAAGLGPEQEVYSIDETFISLAGVPGGLFAWSRAVRSRILQWLQHALLRRYRLHQDPGQVRQPRRQVGRAQARQLPR